MLGTTPAGKAVCAYFIMGRSENSRNRVFEKTDDGIRTRAWDESKMTDPSLIIYHPVRRMPDGTLIVTNGDQTDTVRDFLAQGKGWLEALCSRTFEPDEPNCCLLYTSRRGCRSAHSLPCGPWRRSTCTWCAPGFRRRRRS